MTDDVRSLTVRVPEAARMLGVSRAQAYRWASDGVLPTVRVGGVVLIPVAALERWVANRTEAARR